jgi:hypothetical protein
METDRVCVQGRVGRISWLQKMEVVFIVTTNNGPVKVWLAGDMTHDESLREHAEIKVYGRTLGNLLVAEQLVFSPNKRPRYKIET